MASGGSRGRGRGRGSRASAGASPPLALPPAVAADPSLAAVSDPQMATLPAADLVARLIGCNRRASDFVDAALVLSSRERRLAAAESRARAAEEDAARLRREIAAEAEIRRLIVVTELRMQDQIREWQRRACLAEAHLQAYAQAHAGGGVAGLAGGGEEGMVQAAVEEGRREEAPPLLQDVVSGGKRKEAVALSPEKRLKKKIIKLRAEEGCCSNAVLPESEADTTIDEAEAEDALEDQDALAIIPVVGCGVHDGLEMGINDKQGLGENDQPEGETRGEPEEFDEPEINTVALAVLASGHDLPPNDDGIIGIEARDLKEEGGQEKEPELDRTAAAYAQGCGDESGGDDESLEDGVKEDERQATLASASQPNHKCWLDASLPKESVGVEERPDDDDDDKGDRNTVIHTECSSVDGSLFG